MQGISALGNQMHLAIIDRERRIRHFACTTIHRAVRASGSGSEIAKDHALLASYNS
jgi:hypothetical protein